MNDLTKRRRSSVLIGFLILIVALGVVLSGLSLFNLTEKVQPSPLESLAEEELEKSQTPDLMPPDWSKPVYLVKRVSWDAGLNNKLTLSYETSSNAEGERSLGESSFSEVKETCQIAFRFIARTQIELRAAQIRDERLKKKRLATIWRKVNGDKVVASWSDTPRPYLLVKFPVKVAAVALTFDDGPHPLYTKRILNILKKHKVHATFFVVGTFAKYYPTILRRIVKEGNELGNHTYSHLNSAKASQKLLRKEIEATDRLIEEASGHSGKWFRPPGALIDGGALKVARSLNYQVVLWDVDSLDWQKPNPKKLAKRVLSLVKPGSIVLFHDGGGERDRTVAALPIVIKGLKKRSLKIVTISELVEMVRQKQAKNF